MGDPNESTPGPTGDEPLEAKHRRSLESARRGHARARDPLLPAVYAELREIAARYLRRERHDHTLQPTALVHEAYLRLFDPGAATAESRTHFLALAARAMRQILVDHARARAADKRGSGKQHLTLSAALGEPGAAEVDLVALDEALERLSALSERQGRVVELRFFAGLDVVEVAEVLSVSRSTVEAEWRVARAWLAAHLDVSGGAAA